MTTNPDPDSETLDLLADHYMPADEQLRLVEGAIAAVNRLVKGQGGLQPEVLRCAVRAQIECYRDARAVLKEQLST